jgi:hypothetical protein
MISNLLKFMRNRKKLRYGPRGSRQEYSVEVTVVFENASEAEDVLEKGTRKGLVP